MRRSRDEHRTNRPLRVLESFSGIRRQTNPYIAMLWEELRGRPDLDVRMFSWRVALLGRYDILHVHWPELLMGGRTLQGRLVRRGLTTALCVRLTILRTPVVRTWHNLDRPSDLSWWDHRLLDALEALTALRIRLNPASPVPAGTRATTVLHGDYRRWFAAHPRQDRREGTLTYVGLIRRYKGVEELLAAFGEVPDPGLSLHVAGAPSSPELAEIIRAAARADPRVKAQLEFLDDADFVTAVTQAQLVVLPYRHMHNSGTVLAVLSLGRPVLVPDNEVNRLLREEVGEGWVHLFEPPLRGSRLSAAMAETRRSAPREADLSARSWAGAGDAHADAFRSVARLG